MSEVNTGRQFDRIAMQLLSEHFGVQLGPGTVPGITTMRGNLHKFDLTSPNLRIVGEVKDYAWRANGGIPQAKLAHLDSDLDYLSRLPRDTVRFIAMRRDLHRAQRESLAEYYSRLRADRLNGVFIIEIEIETSRIRELRRTSI